ncbi:hypothetical protein, partial [Methylobacterium sp. WL7]|uniref:hypothetical protein n=1 Tax=Methylobacterium sp. WL7 TaxID=2603900 RepID=UPI001AEF22CA
GQAGMKVDKIYSFTSIENISDHLPAVAGLERAHKRLAQRIALVAKYIFNWRLRGDEFVVVMSRRQ